MDADLLSDCVSWWTEVSSCVYSRQSSCLSGSLALLSLLSIIISYILMLCYRCKVRAGDVGSVVCCSLYCLTGNMCNSAGSVLSHQNPLQIIMAFLMAGLDLMLLLSVVVPFCWWRHSKPGKRERMMSRRRRQNALGVCLMFGLSGCVYFGRVTDQSDASQALTGRRLLGIFLHDSTDVLGYVLGLLSFVISWTSRFPFFLRASKEELHNLLHVSSRLLSALSGSLYASAILLYNTQLEDIVKALPWILSGACCAVLDVSILLISSYRTHHKRPAVQTLDPDTVSLLDKSSRPTSVQNQPQNKSVRKKHLPSGKSSRVKTSETGHYMDVNSQPVRKVCLKEVTITQGGSADNQSLKRSVKVVRIDDCYSSGNTTDSSSVSSELEWDFEEAAPQWSPQHGDPQNPETFPLQDWTEEQRLKCNSRPGFQACFCSSVDLEQRTGDINLNLSNSVK